MTDKFKQEIENMAREIINKIIDKKIVGILPKGRYRGETGLIVISIEGYRRIVKVYNGKKS